ncbi:hypothetical protein ACFL6M_06485 [Candidatus Eisenbacteria bacterium]|uniref:Uncharacterized protein n=1 Tax=Eiseniibacteriota bacterium TaxID=2212470 RepID=A0ABV6YLM1_UNCEI
MRKITDDIDRQEGSVIMGRGDPVAEFKRSWNPKNWRVEWFHLALIAVLLISSTIGSYRLGMAACLMGIVWFGGRAFYKTLQGKSPEKELCSAPRYSLRSVGSCLNSRTARFDHTGRQEQKWIVKSQAGQVRASRVVVGTRSTTSMRPLSVKG